MNDNEKYLYDLQGYITVPNALSADQLLRLNQAVDEHIEAECPPDMWTHRFFDTIDWGGALLELIDNPVVMPYLDGTIGNDKYRLDHVYLDVIRAGKGPIGTRLHGGATPFRASQYSRFVDGRMWNGLSVVGYNLHDVGPMDGGFGAVPGSHKSNYPFPEDWKEMEELNPIVNRVTGPAGTAVVFTEALAHGTLPWIADHERRTLFFKYSPHSISWYARYYIADDYEGLTERQRTILEPPNDRYSDRYERTPGS
jgi:hypothetical protein